MFLYSIDQAIESEQHVARLLRNRDVYTWHDEKIGKFPRADSTRNNYDLNYKSSRWMFTVINSDVNNSSEIKAFSQSYLASHIYRSPLNKNKNVCFRFKK